MSASELNHALHQGFAFLQTQNIGAALPIFQKLLGIYPQSPDVWNGWGLCAEAQENWDEAESAFLKSLELRPNDPEVLNNLAIFYQQRQVYPKAIEILKVLLDHHPHAYGYYNLAQNYLAFSQSYEAIEALELALKLLPKFEAALLLYVQLCENLNLASQAKVFIKTLQNQLPYWALTYYLLGNFAFKAKELETAVYYFYQALKIDPSLEKAYYQLSETAWGFVAFEQHRKGIQILEKLTALEFASDFMKLELLCVAPPPIYQDVAEVKKWRQFYETELPHLLKADFPIRHPMRRTHFYLTYQGYDDRELSQQISALHQRFLPEIILSPVQKSPQKRIGFVSSYFYAHSVSFCFLNLIRTFVDSDFEVFLFSIDLSDIPDSDSFRQYFKENTQFFKLDQHQTLEKITQTISAEALDILIYTDIGMDPKTYQLAHYRLATHQLVLPGHPVTTGIPNMDYFISPAALEISESEAQKHYSEKLICLPGGPDYERPELPGVFISREELGLSPQAHIYLCPMTLFKVHPEFDQAIAEILRQDPLGEVIFFKDRTEYFARELQQRFYHQIPDVFSKIRFFPWQPRQRFLHYLGQAEVVLDTFYFGCGNTAYLTLACGTPLLSWPTEQMRTRGVKGLYQLMGMENAPVAASQAEYVELALKIANEPETRAKVKAEILAKNHRLFNDPTHNQALLKFCNQLVH